MQIKMTQLKQKNEKSLCSYNAIISSRSLLLWSVFLSILMRILFFYVNYRFSSFFATFVLT